MKEGRVSHFKHVLLHLNFVAISFSIKNQKKCIFQFSDSLTFEQSPNKTNCHTFPFEIPLAVATPNIKHIC